MKYETIVVGIKMSHLKIDKVTEDENSLFTSKSLTFHNLTIQTPFKLLDFNNAPPVTKIEAWNNDILNQINIVEKSKLVSEKSFISELDNPKANFLYDQYDSYKNTKGFGNKYFVNSLTLQFNPIQIDGYKDNIDIFMQLYHCRSDLLLVPNLKVARSVNGKREELVSFDDYKKYISVAYEALNFRNSKPIFVPLSLKHGVRKFQELLKEYIDSGYRYFWLDFEAASSYNKTPFIRSYHKLIEEKELIDKVVLYATNIRRENNPHINDITSIASDVVSSPLGIDILGVNRSPQAMIKVPQGGCGSQEDKTSASFEESFNHKARFLNTDSYGYVKFSNVDKKEEIFKKYKFDETKLRDKTKFYTNIVNTFEINSEFQNQLKIMKNDESILDYLGTKTFVLKDKIKNFARTGIKNISKTKQKNKKTELKKSRSLDEFF